MKCPTVKEIRNLKAKGTAQATRAAKQAQSIREQLFRCAYYIIDIVDPRTREVVDAYPLSKDEFRFFAKELRAKRQRSNETPEQTAQRQHEEIQSEQSRIRYKELQVLRS